MSLVSHALGFARFRRESPVMVLLRSENLPVVLAVIAQYFPQGALARPAQELYPLLDEDLRQLRGEGFTLPKGPQDYIGDWVRSGWLVRRPGTSRTGETLEPSEDVLAVLDALQRWDNPHRSVSASRIEALSQALQTLALESDPDVSRRLGELEREREEIERRIEATHRGEFEVLSPRQIEERVADILDLAAAIPADFARVRHEMGDLNRQLRRQLLDPEDSRGDVLEEIFRGVDLISSSDAGRSFTSFFEVLLDRERSTLLDRWITEVLGRDEAQEVPEQLRVGLYRVFRDMEEASYEVSQEMTGLARSLRHYVTTEEFAENRRMVQLLRATRHAAAQATQEGAVAALNQLDTPLVRIGMQLRSVAAMALRNPGEERVEAVPQQIPEVELDAMTLMEQIRASEIDFEELEEAVASVLATQSVATIPEILELNPATQGLASVVGLLYLAMSRGGEGRADLGLSVPAGRVRLRFPMAEAPGGLSDVELPLGELVSLPAPVAVVMVENLETFLALPTWPGVVLAWGAGYRAIEIVRAPYFQESPLIYWGDLDADGYGILDAVRSVVPGARSALMDRGTVQRWCHLGVKDQDFQVREYPRLKEAELAGLEALIEAGHLRIEQERIRFDLAVVAVEEAFSAAR